MYLSCVKIRRFRLSLIPFIVFLTFNTVAAQSTIHIEGIVQSEDGEALYKSLISVGKASSISSISGYYRFDIPKTDSIRLAVSYLGYATMDTVFLRPLNDSLVVNFKLKRTSFSLPEVSVRPQTQSLFDRSDWIILDYLTVSEYIVLLVIDANKRWLYTYSIEGKFVSRLTINKHYNQLHKSCLGSIYVLGKRFYAKVDSLLKIVVGQKDIRKKFDQFIAPCLFQFDDRLIFKSWQQHNQRADYFYYQKQQSVLLYSIYDKQAQQMALSQYNRIISMYYQARSSSAEEDIDAGFQRENIIEGGRWNGDLTNLIVTNKIHQEVGYYEAVLTRPVRTWEAIARRNKLIIIDFIEQQAVLFSNRLADRFTTISAAPLIWEDKKGTILNDVFTTTVR